MEFSLMCAATAHIKLLIFTAWQQGVKGSGGVDMRYNHLLLYKYSTKD